MQMPPSSFRGELWLAERGRDHTAVRGGGCGGAVGLEPAGSVFQFPLPPRSGGVPARRWEGSGGGRGRGRGFPQSVPDGPGRGDPAPGASVAPGPPLAEAGRGGHWGDPGGRGHLSLAALLACSALPRPLPPPPRVWGDAGSPQGGLPGCPPRGASLGLPCWSRALLAEPVPLPAASRGEAKERGWGFLHVCFLPQGESCSPRRGASASSWWCRSWRFDGSSSLRTPRPHRSN